MRLGINFTHDSSVVLASDVGEIIFAQQEERINRKKNTSLFPINSILKALDIASKNNEDIISLHFGTLTPYGGIRRVLHSFEVEQFPSFDGHFGYIYPPGESSKFLSLEEEKAEYIFKNKIGEIFPALHYSKSGIQYFYENHQDSHASSAFFASGFDQSLSFSLDGHGDGESGSVSIFSKYNKIRKLARFEAINSFGHLYAAVTARYNFKPGYHEGKITGLAAFGNNHQVVEFLLQFLEVKQGMPKFNITETRLKILAGRLLKRARLSKRIVFTLQDLIDAAESKTTRYPDLAFAIQEVLNTLVLELVDYWIKKTGISNVSGAGGVFANVKLNQLIQENSAVSNFFVFPAMGDTGIAAGSIWNSLYRLNQKIEPDFQDMFLGEAQFEFPEEINLEDFCVEEFSGNQIYEEVANRLSKGKLVGIIKGRMEFGPRALCNRSLLIDPRDPSVNNQVNKRLKRTEFMPFAPVCRERDFENIFHASAQNPNFKFMTQTCRVREAWINKIPAAVHIDGTARPQIIKVGDDPVMENIIEQFELLTGCPVLINTSLNIHEQPIVENLIQVLPSVKDKTIDYLVFQNKLISSF